MDVELNAWFEVPLSVLKRLLEVLLLPNIVLPLGADEVLFCPNKLLVELGCELTVELPNENGFAAALLCPAPKVPDVPEAGVPKLKGLGVVLEVELPVAVFVPPKLNAELAALFAAGALLAPKVNPEFVL